MHCSFLVRLGESGEYRYLILEGCENGKQNLVALQFWLSQNADHGITASNFNEMVRKHKIPTSVWVKFPHAVSVVHQQYIIKLVEVRPGTKTLIAEPGKTLMNVADYLK